MSKARLKNEEDYREYVGIEPGPQYANQQYISIDKDDMETKKFYVERIIRFLIQLMKAESPAFKRLYVDLFGGGSGYEGLKITKPDEFDIDILMRIPEPAAPVLLENNIPGYVNLKLEHFQRLQHKYPEVYEVMQDFVDDNNYLLTKEMKSSFMQSIFDRVMNTISNNTIQVLGSDFRISRVQNLGPAFTLTIEGLNELKISVDLVPCILLDGSQWPGEGFEPNPYTSPSDFFIVPKSPRRDVPHIDRYWRLSFQKQEREIIFDRQWLKPTIRVLKRIRDNFQHRISSYAIKTMFFRELKIGNPTLDDDTPALWSLPFSYCVVHMLEVYATCLHNSKIPYFWNKKMDLLDDLTPGQKTQYKNDIENMLDDIKANPDFDTILSYLD
ncbi:hypothetical protein Zmor_005238 [Zophobas morio]|uniref:Uncharacterized protein n=1 Tax=Zophobas morio TaxID=2755281 RepID=A0AA38IVM0_9CUCU|nr:hypothetical protein Zmor_005238 [Zophobas morio]